MDEASEIVEAVQVIFDVVSREFIAAAPSMEAGRWTGLDADARARLAQESHKQVERLALLFEAAQQRIDAVDRVGTTPRELEAAKATAGELLAQRRELNARLERLVAEARELDAASAAPVAAFAAATGTSNS